MAGTLYLEVRLFRFSVDEGVLPESPSGLIDARALPFENIANATAVFEDIKQTMEAVAKRGLHKEVGRVRPGRRNAAT